MITNDEKSAISAQMGMNHMRHRRGGYPVISPNGYRLEAAETSIISVTEQTQLTNADNGKTYSLDATNVFLILPNHTGLADGFTVNVQCTQIGMVEVYEAYIGGERVIFEEVGYDGVQLQAAGDTAVLVYSSSGGTWAATGTGTTIGIYD